MNIPQRLAALREAMNDHQIDAYIIPSSDPHQSEYVAERWKSRQWVSGFKGSAGTAVVTAQKAGVWTDSRYFLQAEEELRGTGFDLQKLNVQGAAEYVTWLAQNLEAGSTVGIDGWCFSVNQVRHLKKQFQAKQISLTYSEDLIKFIWNNRPALPSNAVFELETKFAGKSRAEKLSDIRAKMAEKGVHQHLIATLDDIAWIFNLRGYDVECNPVAIAYAIIEEKRAYLFIDEQKVKPDFANALKQDNVIIKNYDEITYFLDSLPDGQHILIDTDTVNIRLYDAINKNCTIVEGQSISTPMKGLKNAVEMQHLREVMKKDGVALLRLYRWLERELKTRSVKETEIARQLIECRRNMGEYYGESFEAIVGYKGNGAIVHYRPEEATCAAVKNEGILLLDSGGQYWNGTTDITRTTTLSQPTEEQKKHFTLVLKGHIGIARLKFPTGTRGNQMDTLARQHLWQHGLNYGHGTGHGVGFFLNVHEGPQGIGGTLVSRFNTAFEVGMYTSNEPGFYKTGEYGIRIENLVLTQEAETTEFGKFLCFETITLFPIDTQLVAVEMLTSEERSWLNDYHARVYKEISPLLTEEEAAWLQEKCKAI